MKHYRIYKLKPNGHIFRVEAALVDTDDAAIAHAVSLAHPHAVEVWQEARRIGIIEPSKG